MEVERRERRVEWRVEGKGGRKEGDVFGINPEPT